MKRERAVALAAGLALAATAMGGYPRMWVYNHYRMSTDEGWQNFSNMVVRAAAAGYNGVLTSAQLENGMNNWDKRARANYAKARDLCAALGLEIIPGVWGLGYGGPVCYWDPETVEATAVKGAPYVCENGRLRFDPQPVSAEAFNTADFGVRQVKAHLKPFTHYRITFKLKTENLLPDIYHKFRLSCWYKAGGSQLYDPPMKPTQDWTDVTFTFDTYESGEMTFSDICPSMTLRMWKSSDPAVWQPIPANRRSTCSGGSAIVMPLVISAERGGFCQSDTHVWLNALLCPRPRITCESTSCSEMDSNSATVYHR